VVKTKRHINPGLVLAALALSASGAWGAPIAVVRGDAPARQNPAETRAVGGYHQTVKDCLAQEGVVFDELTGPDVAAGKLAGHRIAILTYHSTLSDAELAALEKFLDRDGKIILFYGAPPRLAARLGFRLLQHEQSDPVGLFSAMRFKPGLVAGMPEVVPQPSWNINVVETIGPQARVLAEWIDHTGQPTGRPAWILSTNGAWMSHVLLPGDGPAKRRMLLALLGHFMPTVWEKTAWASFRASGQVGPHKRLDELEASILSTPLTSAARQDAQRDLVQARAARRHAMELLLEKRYVPALAAADEARQLASTAYYRIQPSKRGEFRGAWIHSPYGINDWGWDRTARTLRESGFNALFPNLLWAGLAHYPSQVLPVADRLSTQGDQLAECLKACRQHHLQIHVWKVCLNLATAPTNFLARLRAEGRTQKGRTGEDLDWLCPSHPDNFALERDSLLEVVRNYDVDGIHFDYIRYPGAGACFCEGCRARFQQAAGVKIEKWPAEALNGPLAAPFADWRRDQITRLVKTVSLEARQLKPGLRISAAVFGDWASARQDVGQDWKLWVDSGFLDFVCPMDYETDDRDFAWLVRQQAGWVNRKIPFYAGLGAYKMSTPAQLIRQILLARESGADGFVLFQHDARLATEFLPALRLGVTSTAPE
jgi:uncharacterized lipoprotein YddW (UPF0748 family)